MPVPPRIGVRLDPRLPVEADPGARLEALLARCADLDSSGIDVVWIAERPTSESALIPSALIFCTALALRTRRLKIATGLLPLPLYHPLRIAEDAASLDGLSDGRFELGVGLGSDPDAMARFGVDGEERAERFDEALELLQQAWKGQPLDFGGKHFPCDGLAVFPMPVQPGGPPLWVGAAAPSAQKRVAERSCGLVIRSGDACSAYLERWQDLDSPLPARVALLLPSDDRAALPEALIRNSTEVRLDLVLPWPENTESDPPWGEELERIGAAAERLRAETTV